MKNAIIISGISLLLVSFSGCKKESPSCKLFPARIIRYDCDRVIFKLLNDEMIGDTDWEDVQTGQHYSNVVSYYNTCRIAALTNGRLDTLYVEVKKINENLQPDCMQCQAISSNPPATRVDMISLSKENCSGDNSK